MNVGCKSWSLHILFPLAHALCTYYDLQRKDMRSAFDIPTWLCITSRAPNGFCCQPSDCLSTSRTTENPERGYYLSFNGHGGNHICSILTTSSQILTSTGLLRNVRMSRAAMDRVTSASVQAEHLRGGYSHRCFERSSTTWFPSISTMRAMRNMSPGVPHLNSPMLINSTV